MDIVVNDTKDRAPISSAPLSGQEDYYCNILIALGYKPESLPLAGFLSFYHSLSGNWIVATPIHWEATHNDAMIIATGKELELSEVESRQWLAKIAEFLHDDDFHPVFHDPGTWLFKVDGKPQITSRSVHSILHHSIMPILNSLDSSLYWQRIITELQMYLSSHPLNAKRKLPINGLWFWGEGKFKCNRPVATDDKKLLKLVCSSICLLTPATIIEKNHLIIINDPKQIEFCHLEDRIRKSPANWYWNNLAYSTQIHHWWSRLWR